MGDSLRWPRPDRPARPGVLSSLQMHGAHPAAHPAPRQRTAARLQATRLACPGKRRRVKRPPPRSPLSQAPGRAATCPALGNRGRPPSVRTARGQAITRPRTGAGSVAQTTSDPRLATCTDSTGHRQSAHILPKLRRPLAPQGRGQHTVGQTHLGARPQSGPTSLRLPEPPAPVPDAASALSGSWQPTPGLGSGGTSHPSSKAGTRRQARTCQQATVHAPTRQAARPGHPLAHEVGRMCRLLQTCPCVQKA